MCSQKYCITHKELDSNQWVYMILKPVAGAAMQQGSLQTTRGLDASGHWDKLVGCSVVDQQLNRSLVGVSCEQADEVTLGHICYV